MRGYGVWGHRKGWYEALPSPGALGPGRLFRIWPSLRRCFCLVAPGRARRQGEPALKARRWAPGCWFLEPELTGEELGNRDTVWETEGWGRGRSGSQACP